MLSSNRYLFLLFTLVFGALPVFADLEALFEERARSTVYLEYFIEREMDRQKSEAVGTVLNDEGLVVFLGNAFPDWLPPEQFKDIRVHASGNPSGKGFSGEFLGADMVTGWTYVRVEESAREHLVPITEFPSALPRIGDRLWGICLTGKDLDYVPYLRSGYLSLKMKLPLWTGFSSAELAAPGAPVFDLAGHFVGWAGNPFPIEHEMWIGSDYFQTSLRIADESPVFLLAEDFFKEAGTRIPESPLGERRPWVGISGTQPIDEDSAEFLGLESQGVLVVSEVIPGTPAEKAGMQDRDLIVAIDGETLPRMKPDNTLQTYFERAVLTRGVGETIVFGLLRGTESLSVEIELAEGPKPLREAARQYFETMGVTFREFLMGDALQRRSDPSELKGMLAGFVRPNSPAATAGFQPGDWVLEMGGELVENLESGVAMLESEPEGSQERVFLIKRGSETQVLRVKLD